MSKRMVAYSLTGEDKIASIDGHEVGSGGVGDKSISRRMITYKLDDAGKITSIDGHELNGGGGDYEIKPLEVTENGVYDVAGEAYKPVRVNVPQATQSGTLKAVLDATRRASYLFSYYNGGSVDNLIRFSDTSNVTNMSYMFYYCNNLTSIPLLDTSNVTNMGYMFSDCSNLITIPKIDTYKVNTMTYMFSSCMALTSIPELITSNVTDMGYMFYYCNNLTSIPLLDTSNVTNMGYMFSGCSKLTSIPELDTSKVANMTNMFYNCTKLTSIGIYGFTRAIDISSTALGHDAIVAFLNQAGTAYNSSQKIKMGSTKLALLSEEEKAIATNKGWQLA